MERFDVVVVGAGAAGMMCALTAGQRGRRVLLLDHADEPGKKILISGGGRCNFTNLEAGPERFVSANPHFAKSALKRYTQHDFLGLIAKHRIAWHEKKLGQLFCDHSARDIVAMLLAECRAGGVDLRLSHRLTCVTKPDEFHVETERAAFAAPALVVATGGLSIPKMGATGLAYDLARGFGMAVTKLHPALVPLKAAGADLDFMQPLSGVSTEVVATCGRKAFRENLLFTHRGLSGPAILQISSYWRAGEVILIDLLPDEDASFLLARKAARPKAEAKTVLAEVFPARLAEGLAERLGLERPIGEIADKALRQAGETLKRFVFNPVATEGYAKAEVTLGGVDTDGLSSKTMEARAVPGLYFIGEAVDVTGWLGGYNFQWAWSSGWVAGMAVSEGL